MASVVMVLLGAGILAANTVEVVQGAGRISELRAHGRRVPGSADIVRTCSHGVRDSSCSTSNVWLSFRDAHGLDLSVAEPRLAHTLYVPEGPVDRDHVHTTVVYDPSDPDEYAQAAGVLKWNAWNLIEHRWLVLTIGLVLTVAGAGALAGDRIGRHM